MLKKLFLIIIIVFLLGAGGAGFYFWKTAQGEPAYALEVQYAASDRFVDIAGARVRVREEGDKDAPVIILIHGFSFSLESWDAWAETLKSDYRIVRYDLLGHGLTGPDPQERYAPQERAAFLGDVMDALDLPSAILAGNSLGGLAAWRFAADNPERVNALIMVSPGAYPYNGINDTPTDIPAAMKAYLLTAPEAGVSASASLVYHDDAKVTERRLKIMRDMIRREGNGAAMIKSLEEFTLPSPTQALARISAPTLILWGEEDAIIPVEQGHQLERDINNARLITYPGVGHAAQEEAPDISVQDAISFLTALDSSETETQ